MRLFLTHFRAALGLEAYSSACPGGFPDKLRQFFESLGLPPLQRYLRVTIGVTTYVSRIPV